MVYRIINRLEKYCFDVDISKSMVNEDKLNLLKNVFGAILKTLISNDWIGIVIFSTKADLYLPKMVRATKANIENLIDYIKNLQVIGGTNYADAFQAANDLLKNSFNQGSLSGCKTYLIFLTDGIPQTGISEKSSLIQFIDNLQYLKNSVVFSYILGSKPNVDIPKAISCLRKGYTETISNLNDLSTKLNSYFQTISIHMFIC